MKIIRFLLQKASRVINDEHLKEVASGSFLALTFKFMGIISGYIATLVISNYYGAKVTGVFNLAFVIINMALLVGLLGFQTAIIRFTNELKERGQSKDILKKMIIVSLSLSAVIAIGLEYFSKTLSLNLFQEPLLEDYVRLMAFTLPPLAIFTILVEYIRALRNIMFSEMLRNSISVLFLATILLFTLWSGTRPLVPAKANVLATFLACLTAIIFFMKKLGGFSDLQPGGMKLSSIVRISLPMLFTASMFTLMGSIDRLMLGFFRNSAEVGIYSVALKVSSVVNILLVAINSIIAPKFAQLFWRNEWDSLENIIRFSTRLIFYSTLPCITVFLFFPTEVLSLFGRDFSSGSTTLLILTSGQVVNCLAGSVGYFLDLTGNQKIFRNIVAISTILNILLNMLLIPTLGIKGAAIATALSTMTWNITALLYIKRRYGIYLGYRPF